MPLPVASPPAAIVLAVVILMTVPAPAALASSPAETLERAGWLERVRGDAAAAEQAYRDALDQFPAGDPLLAEALFRYGALLIRTGRAAEAVADERAPLRRLQTEFPARRDLLARADRLLIARSAPPEDRPVAAAAPPGPSGERESLRPRARVLAVRDEARLIAVGLGAEDGVEVGTPLVIYRAGKVRGEAIAVRVAPGMAAARLIGNDAAVAVGDEVRFRWPVEPPAPVRAGAATSEPLAEAARRFLDATSGADREETLLAEGARPDAIVVEVRVFAADGAFLRSLPFAFERGASGVGGGGDLLGPSAAPLARLRPADERVLLDRTRATALIDLRRIALDPARRAAFALGEKPAAGAAPGTTGPAARPPEARRDLKIGLALAPDPARPREVALELEAIALDRPPEPLAYPGQDRPIAVPVSRFQRIATRVALDPEHPAALVGGLRDPAGQARDVLILVSLPGGAGARD